MNVFYSDLAPYWPLVSQVEDYEGEAGEFTRLIQAHLPGAHTVLELGSGGGSNAWHLKRHFALTLTDLSRAMLATSARLNPDCEHIEGDMRTLDLGRTFDVVFVHDAIDYMTTEADLQAAMATAYRHCRPGGLAVFVPDHVRERYAPGTDQGGADGPDGRALRYLEWNTEVLPNSMTCTTHYCFLVRDLDGAVRCLHEVHELGLFPLATWVALLEGCGFAVDVVEERAEDDHEPRLIFLARKGNTP